MLPRSAHNLHIPREESRKIYKAAGSRRRGMCYFRLFCDCECDDRGSSRRFEAANLLWLRSLSLKLLAARDAWAFAFAVRPQPSKTFIKSRPASHDDDVGPRTGKLNTFCAARMICLRPRNLHHYRAIADPPPPYLATVFHSAFNRPGLAASRPIILFGPRASITARAVINLAAPYTCCADIEREQLFGHKFAKASRQ